MPQVSPHDCTGCELCVHVCPDDALTATPILDVLAPEAANWDFMQTLPNRGSLFDKSTVRGSQFQQPLMEFSGACEGCGETPYVKRKSAAAAAAGCQLLLYAQGASGQGASGVCNGVSSRAQRHCLFVLAALCHAAAAVLTQMFGERMVVANATGCSSIWGGSAPSNPYTVNPLTGRGPAWANSLFEDNAQFGLGISMGLKQRRASYAAAVRSLLADKTGPGSMELRNAFEEWLQVQRSDLRRRVLACCLCMFGSAALGLGSLQAFSLSCADVATIVCVHVQVKDNGLLCHQAVDKLNPLLKAEATTAQAPGALQWLYNNGADMLEKPSMWIIVSAGLGCLQGGVFFETVTAIHEGHCQPACDRVLTVVCDGVCDAVLRCRVATAGPTTSALAVWTTCWPRARTSTSWCWTQRCTATLAARRCARASSCICPHCSFPKQAALHVGGQACLLVSP